MPVSNSSANVTTITTFTASYPPAHEPLPARLILPNAPCPNPVVFPGNGINLLYGRSAPLILSQALRLAQARGLQAIHATLTVKLRVAEVLTTPITPENLADTDVLLLEVSYTAAAIEQAINDYLDRVVGKRAVVQPGRRPEVTFGRVSRAPQLIAHLFDMPALRHLKAFIYTVPASKRGSAARFLYLRDFSAITRIQSAAPECSFILPPPAELADTPPYNPFQPKAAPIVPLASPPRPPAAKP